MEKQVMSRRPISEVLKEAGFLCIEELKCVPTTTGRYEADNIVYYKVNS